MTANKDSAPIDRGSASPRPRLAPTRAAASLYAVVFIVVLALRLTDAIHGMSYGFYEAAANHWLAEEPLYDLTDIEGFQYLPQAAMAFVPFAVLGWPWGNVLWRLLEWVLLAFGVRRCTALLAPSHRDEAFFVATCFAIGPAIGPLGNGQANLLLAALSLHVAADVMEKRWWRGACVAVFGVAMKPLFAVLTLLMGALFAPMRWRIVLACGVAFLIPWLVADPAYVSEQYAALVPKLRLGAKPGPDYEDLRGMLATLGWVVPHDVATLLRVTAALATLAAGVVAIKRVREPYVIALIVGLAAAYLMVFNPRSQSTSYAIPGAIVAVLAAATWCEGRRRAFSVLLVVQIAFTLNHNYIPPIELWLKPLAAIALGAFVVRETLDPPIGHRQVSNRSG